MATTKKSKIPKVEKIKFQQMDQELRYPVKHPKIKLPVDHIESPLAIPIMIAGVMDYVLM